MIVVGIDDTDMPDTRGTGKLARIIAADLAADFTVVGVVRHQLWFDPQVPYTAKNSSAALILHAAPQMRDRIFARVEAVMRPQNEDGSDPGLAVASADISPTIIDWGYRAKRELLQRDEAFALARQHNIRLRGLAGTQDGVIGALASIGLTHSSNDGRYIQIGTIRDVTLPCSVERIQQTGIVAIRTRDDRPVTRGMVHGKNLRPARRNAQAILYVEQVRAGVYHALKIN